MPRDLHVETAVFPWPTWNIKRSKSFANCHSAKQSRFSFTSAKWPNIPGTSRIPACQRWHTLHLWKLRFGGFEKVCVLCLGRQICYRSVCPMNWFFFLRRCTNEQYGMARAGGGGYGSSINQAIFHRARTCHTVTWIPGFSILTSPPLPPSFSYIMNNAGWITDPQLTGQLTLAFYSKGVAWTVYHTPHNVLVYSTSHFLGISSAWVIFMN